MAWKNKLLIFSREKQLDIYPKTFSSCLFSLSIIAHKVGVGECEATKPGVPGAQSFQRMNTV